MKTSKRRDRWVAVGCAAAALAVSGGAVLATLSANGWRVSALVRISGSDPIAPLVSEVDPSFHFVHPQAHYDGTYFYAIARDPLARGDAHLRIDRAAYRYSHAGYGWLAWLASAGRASAVPAALLGVGLTGMAVAGYAASRLARELGLPAWGGLVVALSPGAIFAATVDTSEPVGLAAVALGLLAWRRRRWFACGAAFVAACLIKEPLVLIPAGLAAWELLQWSRGETSENLAARAAALVVGPAALLAWLLYLREIFGVWPLAAETEEFLTFPFTGWVDSFRRAAALVTGAFESNQIGGASVPLLATVGGAIAIGALRSARARSWLEPAFLLCALLIFSLNWLGILYPKDLLRETTLTLALLPAVLAGAGRDEHDPGSLAEALGKG